MARGIAGGRESRTVIITGARWITKEPLSPLHTEPDRTMEARLAQLGVRLSADDTKDAETAARASVQVRSIDANANWTIGVE